ncbi:hypothetical protein GC176_07695 [bacterium]|nr:hypothetical protein [bacterium]
MKTRKRDDDEDGGLDSLLDTMTNVVGILVLVLIVTQLGVSDALTEIKANSNVTQEDLNAAKQQLASLAQEKQQLAEQASSMVSFDIEAERERLRRLKETLDARKKLLADESKQANEFSLALQHDRETAAKNKKEIEETQEKRKELQTELEKSLDRRAELQALLDKTPRRSGPAPEKVVTIPNPRPAPEGARQVILVCAENRLYPLNLDEIRQDAELRSKQIITRQRLNLDPAKGIDPEKFETLYTKLRYPADDFFEVEYYVADKRWPRMKLIPKAGRGAAETELRRPQSRIRKLLAQLDPQKFYARFYVLPDSFDVYLTARQVMAEQNVLAGWEPESQNWIYTAGVGGGIELGPPRPPNPNPPPATPAKPANVID